MLCGASVILGQKLDILYIVRGPKRALAPPEFGVSDQKTEREIYNLFLDIFLSAPLDLKT
jgi:hypothetical protein